MCGCSPQGMKSHQKLQGEILEGLVARVVDPTSINSMNKTLQKYSIPKMVDGLGVDMGPDLRVIFLSNRDSEDKVCDHLILFFYLYVFMGFPTNQVWIVS